MGRPIELQTRFQRGMIRDVPRDQLPDNAAYNLINLIPDFGAALRKRGGYTYASADIAAVSAAMDFVEGGIHARFAAGAQNLAIAEDTGVQARLFRIVSDSSTTDIGALSSGIAQNPVFHRNRVIFPFNTGSATPYSYDGTTLAALTGAPPTAIYATVHKDRTVLLRSTANPNRAWFSDPGDPTAWDTTNTYWDFTYPLTGAWAMGNFILGFSEGHVERLRGSIPPPGSDMILEPRFDVGCTDARSIAGWGDNVIFANPSGIYQTDGTHLDDVTLQAGMKRYWQDTLASYSSGWTLVGGTYQNYYLISVMNGTTFVDAAMIDIPRRAWLRLSNWKARAMWASVGASEELYFGLRSTPRVAKTSSIFSPSATNKNDGDGTAVTYTLESPFYSGKPGEKGMRAIYVAHDTRDAATDNPILTVSVCKTIEGAYRTLSPTLTETTDYTRKRLRLGFSGAGLGVKIVQSNASSDSRLYSLEAEIRPREPSRV